MSYPAAKQSRDPARVVAAGACAVVGLVVFQFFGNAARGYVDTPSVFWWWISQWLDPQAEAEHGWLVLAMAGWMFWRNLKTQARSEAEGDGALWPVVVALGGAMVLHAVGFAAQFTRASIVAALVFAWGVLRLAGGRRWGRAAVFPLGFLLFSIPLNVLSEVGLPLRLWVVAAGDMIAHAAGIEVIRSGTQLLAPDGRFNYDVAAACSGVRSLLALSALAVLMGYLNFRSWWRRGVVALVCLPLVYVGNVARIVAIIFAAQRGGQVWGDRAHAVMGWGVFAIVLGGVLAVVALVQRWWPESVVQVESEGNEGREVGPTAVRRVERRSVVALWLLVGALVVGAGAEIAFIAALRRAPPTGAAGVVLTPDGRAPVELPGFLGVGWVGRRTEVTAIEREVLPPDTGFSRKVYVPTADVRRQVLLSIVLSGRDRTSIHRPELCLVGQGWTITGKAEHRFNAPEGGAFPATVLRVEREMASANGPVVVPSVIVYWFVNADTVVATHPQRILRDMWNRLTKGRVDRWAYVLLQADAIDGEAAALNRMQEVLTGTLPAFQRVGPNAP